MKDAIVDILIAMLMCILMMFIAKMCNFSEFSTGFLSCYGYYLGLDLSKFLNKKN